MTTKAVFFDWFSTLVRIEPDRHVVCVETCREFGINIDPERALRGIYSAEEEVPEGRPFYWSSGADPGAFIRYNDIVLRAAGAATPDSNTTLRMVERARERMRDINFLLLDDVHPALAKLKERGLALAVLSNMNRPLEPYFERLGLTALLDFCLVPADVGGRGKPDEPIFLEALKRAGVQPCEAVHVGDESFVDGAGARRVGINPVLIDRFGLFADFNEYARIGSLLELPALLDTMP
jgi:HAD superfamily hydrolase (TIGR01549 family)